MDGLVHLPSVLSKIFEERPLNSLDESDSTPEYICNTWGTVDIDPAPTTLHDEAEEPLAWLPQALRKTFDSNSNDDETSRYFDAMALLPGNADQEQAVLETRGQHTEKPQRGSDDRETQRKSDESSSSCLPVVSTRKRKSTARTSHFWSHDQTTQDSTDPSIPAVPFPALRSHAYGLIQEELADDPFKVLIAVIFLVKTKGEAAIPTIRKLFELYPMPTDLAALQPEDLFPDIKHLGLANRRAEAIIGLAKAWVAEPPVKGKRFRRLHYPNRDDGKDIALEELPLDDDDPRPAFEICHLPHMGTYAIDSWRMFCRDTLRGVPSGLRSEIFADRARSSRDNATALRQELQQEWTRVIPSDKELRGYVKWRWLRLGWAWNQHTGERRRISKGRLEMMANGKLAAWQGFANPWQ